MVIDYTMRRSTRSKRMRITVARDGSVVVTIPHRMHDSYAKRFIDEKQAWIQRAQEKRKVQPQPLHILPKRSLRDYTTNKERARLLVTQKLKQWNTHYGYTWNTVSIKNTTSQWGSCSKKRNLNFSYRIIYLPDDLADYLIVHELCHLQEMNHSKQFWNCVARTLPNYATLRTHLKQTV